MEKRPALGKGLSALIPDAADSLTAPRASVDVDVDLLEPNHYQPRGQFDSGTLEDLSAVFYGFTMPAYDLVPDYDSRVEVMRTAGIDRGVFLTEVWGPVLKRLKLTRHDIPRPKRVRAALEAEARAE